MILDFVTTACRRPEILDRTYASFTLRLRGVEWSRCTLHINIDPVGPGTTDDTLDIARRYFGHVEARTPTTPDFAAAVRWCWRQSETPYFVSIEDDWELTHVVAIEELTRQLDADATLACVNLRAYPGFRRDYPICLSPSLLRASTAAQMASRMIDGANPEQQLRPIRPDNPHGGKLGDVRAVQWPHKPVIRDIGRQWIHGTGWRKERERTFNAWINQ
jgi:hypothetical protein